MVLVRRKIQPFDAERTTKVAETGLIGKYSLYKKIILNASFAGHIVPLR